MKIIYLENEKRHIFESETGHMSTFLKERVTKEQAELLFLAQLADAGITITSDTTTTEPEVPVTPEVVPTSEPEAPIEPVVTPEPETVPTDVTPTPENA